MNEEHDQKAPGKTQWSGVKIQVCLMIVLLSTFEAAISVTSLHTLPHTEASHDK